VNEAKKRSCDKLYIDDMSQVVETRQELSFPVCWIRLALMCEGMRLRIVRSLLIVSGALVAPVMAARVRRYLSPAMLRCAAASLTFLALPSCGQAAPERALGPQRVFEVAGPDGAMLCARMNDRKFCVPKAHVDAHTMQFDEGAPGFLILVPVTDPAIAECNRSYWSLSWTFEYPNVSVLIDSFHNETDRKVLYDRLFEVRFDTQIERPERFVDVDGERCFALKKTSHFHRHGNDFVCRGKTIKNINNDYIFSCDRNGSVPFPGCSDFLLDQIHKIKIGYFHDCSSHRERIREIVLRYIDDGYRVGERVWVNR
jgi:hypothetical protein